MSGLIDNNAIFRTNIFAEMKRMNEKKLSLDEWHIMKSQALKALEKFSQSQVLVVGDIGIDEYVKGEVKRISPEAPVPVLNVEQTESRLGLAANVAQNITSLGGSCELVSVVGEDKSALDLKKIFNECGIEKLSLVVDDSRPTTKKTRVIHEAHHIVRIDYEKKEFISPAIEKQVFQSFESKIEQASVVVIEDYNKGIFTENLIQKIIKKSKEVGKLVLVDPHETTPLSFYKGADIITPNTQESFALLNISRDSILDKSITPLLLAQKMMKELGSERMIITQGKDGVSIFENNQWLQLPTLAKQVYDVTGAGDTVIATLALGLSSGLSLPESCLLANYAAGLVVAKVGSVPCSLEDLRASLAEQK